MKFNSACTFDSALTDQTVYVDEPFTYNLPSFSDKDGADSHTLTVVQNGPIALPYFITIDQANRDLIIAPTDNDNDDGNWYIIVTYTDDDSFNSGGTKSCTDDFTLTIKRFNHFPTFSFVQADWDATVYTSSDYNLALL